MPKYIVQTLKAELDRHNIPLDSNKAKRWLIDKARSVSRVSFRELGPIAKLFQIGAMYFFIYDPKTKETLNYYDRLPLVFPIEMYNDGFLGINLHYLAPQMRVRLLNQLLPLVTNKKMDERTRLKLSYDLLNSAKRYELFRPCLKRYLYSQVRSQFIKIDSSEWKIALYIPAERFTKTTKEQVFNRSMWQVRGKK